MYKRILGPLLVVVILVFSVSACFAVIKGLEKSKQSLVKVGESVIVPEGAEVKSTVSVGGSVTVYGTVLEDVVAVGGSVFLKDSAQVGGDIVAVGGKVMKEPGAITKGDIIEVAVGGVTPLVSFFTKGGILKGMALFGLISFVGFIILTIIMVALFTPQLGKVSGAIEADMLRNFLVGLLIAVLFVPIIILLAVSLVGIILIPIWVVVIVIAGLLGYVSVGHLLGKKTLHAFKVYEKSLMVETMVGVILLSLVGLIPIGGHLIKLIAILCGLGGVYQTRFGSR